MRCLHTYIVVALLLTGVFGCGTSEDPEPDADGMLLSTISGEVESIDGVTIQVRLFKDGQQVAQTEADMSYEFTDLEAGEYTVQITAKGHEKIETNVNVEQGRVFQLDKATLVALAEPVSHLTGTFKEMGTGNAISDVLIQLSDMSGMEYEAITSEDGMYTLENLPVNQSFTLTATLYGYEGQDIKVNAIPAEETAEVNVELAAIPETVRLEPSEGIKLGTLAPNFELIDSKNGKYKLSDTLKSKNVVIVFYRGDF